jgi:uncharacterized membrane protein
MITDNAKNPMIFKAISTKDGLVLCVGTVHVEDTIRGVVIKLDVPNSLASSVQLCNSGNDYSALHSIKEVDGNFEIGMITRHEDENVYSDFITIDTDLEIITKEPIATAE